MKDHRTIPEDLARRIVAHRPHLASMVENWRRQRFHSGLTKGLEKHLADNYLSAGGAPDIAPLEAWHLSSCCIGERFGGGSRDP